MGSESYEKFVEKFKNKKTTDDCYTPVPVYDAVVNWVDKKFNLSTLNVVRPFYPGGDYEHYNYQPDDVVIDNPPFSIMKQIVRFYADRKIRFFLFAPHLTLFYYISYATCIITDSSIVYHNGARVKTGFVTNLYPGDLALTIEPSLHDAVHYAVLSLKASKKASYIHDPHVLTAALAGKWHNYHWQVPRSHIHYKATLDNHIKLFGGGILISEQAAKELKEFKEFFNEDNESIRYQLSDDELSIIRSLGR